MEFRILGPLEVREDDAVRTISGARQRALLAILLLHANEPVSPERLAIGLFGEDAPADAVKTIRVNVSRLRRALGDSGLLDTTPAGYRLRVAPGELDSERFQQLTDDGRRAVLGDPNRAAVLLKEALAEWRGPPLADVAFAPFAQEAITRLEEQRVEALDTLIEADLALGHHQQLIADLQQEVRREPLRERLWVQLMLALYRSGRQAEALAAYSEARQALVEEVGVEPGRELRELFDAMLRHDPALVPGEARGRLPPDLEAAASSPLINREPELSRLRARWNAYRRTGSGGIMCLVGEPGIGKTRLAAALAGEAISSGGAVFLANGGGTEDRYTAALEDVRNAHGPTLLVVEDLHRAPHDFGEAFGRLAPLAVLVLATSASYPASQLAGEHETIELRPLDTDNVARLAALHAGSDVDPATARQIARESGGVPQRAHELAGAWARQEAARRVEIAADVAATERGEWHGAQRALAEEVVRLRAVRERSQRLADEAPAQPFAQTCPFKGLAAFDFDDASYFFGREQLVAELVARIVGATLLGVLGPSGSGKSSVVRAGLLPALAGEALPGSSRWARVLIRPGEQPARELDRARADLDEKGKAIVAVDQFEEVFTACQDPQERRRFIDALVALADDPARRHVVVLAVRADFYGRCAAYAGLARRLEANNVLVGRMRRNELRRAIERPAEVAGLDVEDGLSDVLLADVESEPGGLPLLSTALLELWQRREGQNLRLAAYEESGGVRGAVARLAESAFAALDNEEQRVARAILLNLVGEGEGASVVRRRVALAEIAPPQAEAATQVVSLLAERRLLTVSAGTVEVAHEALLREWPRLCGWLEEDAESRRLHRRLREAAQGWDEGGRDPADLYRGPRLAAATEWRAAREPELTSNERRFLDAAAARSRRERAARRRRLQLAFTALVGALVAISAVAVVAVHQSHVATYERKLAVSRELAAAATSVLAADQALSLALAQRGVAEAPTEQATIALRQAVLDYRELALVHASPRRVYGADLAPDGRHIVSAASDGKLAIWTLPAGRAVLTVQAHNGPAVAVRYSPDGRSVASAGDDGVVALTDVSSGSRRVVFRGNGAMATSVAFSPDGAELAAGFSDGSVRVASVGAVAQTLRGPRGPVFGLAYSAGGLLAGASADGTVRVWDPAGTHPAIVLTAGSPQATVSFSPDGTKVLGAGEDGMLRVWRIATGRLAYTVRGSLQSVFAARFTPDGRRIVSAGEDGAIRIIDAESREVTAVLRGHTGRVLDVSVGRSGIPVVSAGEDGTVRTWDPGATRAMRGHEVSVAFSPDGRRIVGGGVDGVVRIWSAESGRVERVLRGQTDLAFARFSPDGRHVISASYDGTVRSWSTRDGRAEFTYRDHRGPVYAAAYDHRGQRVVTGEGDGRIVIRSLGGAAPVVLSGHRGAVYDVNFTPDDRHVISAGNDGTIRIWDAGRADVKPRVLSGHSGAVNSARISRDGRRVVSAGIDGTVRIWNLRSGSVLTLRGHEGAVESADFNPAGNRVVSAGIDGSVRVWDAISGVLLVTLHQHDGRASSAAFSPDGKDVVSAGDDGVVWLATCEVCGPLSDIIALARARVARVLSPSERQRFLDNPSPETQQR